MSLTAGIYKRLVARPSSASRLRRSPAVSPSTLPEISATVAEELGKAFKPERIVFVSALPKTRSAKIVRRAVRARALGRDPGDLSSLENPESLDEIARAV